MKIFQAKVIVKLKPHINDSRGQMIKRAVESFMLINNFSCRVGTSYLMTFEAIDQVEALKIIENIANVLLVNEETEIYEIKFIEEALSMDGLG